MSQESKPNQETQLLLDIREELEEIRTIQQTMARNFNAVVVMIIFGLLIYLVGLFFADQIGRQMDRWLKSTEGGQALEQTVKTVIK